MPTAALQDRDHGRHFGRDLGDIADEYDEANPEVEQVSQHLAGQADIEIDHLADEYEIILPEGDYETVAGLILDRLPASHTKARS